MHKKTHERGQAMITLIIGLIIVGSIFMTGGIKKHVDQQIGEPFDAAITGAPSKVDGKNLQLKTFSFVTPQPTNPPQPTPGTGSTCIPSAYIDKIDNSKTPTQSCGIGIFNSVPPGADAGTCCVEDGAVNSPEQCCSGITVATCVVRDVPYWCDAKPVIYLYPERKTDVSVKVTVPGRISVSIPEYRNGWNVTAYPDGKLISQGKTYSELFYETIQEKTNPPTNGIITKKQNLRGTLSNLTTKLGLNATEQGEFLTYWLPRLNEVNKPYVLISVFSPEQKDEIDHVEINPKPDTFINFIMYYKGIDKPYKIDAPELSPAAKRIGFTAVEWGGILDN